VLVANRGEIAVRIIRACHELGIESVAVYSDADRHARHVRAADVAVRIGPAPAGESYLSAEAIIAAAQATGAEAIHPGYGFLAERATFAAAVESAGLVFVGPDSTAIAAMGDKLAARRLARSVDVPVVPGTLEPAPASDPAGVAAITAAAESLGFPLMVKAAAGGGGRGMRRVPAADELRGALVAASEEALAAFGDGAVYLEREIRPARHIEVQLLGEAGGRVIAIGERDCSIQRRHQKLVEESPAPGLTTRQRLDVHAMAVRIATAAGLTNAATAEFLLDEAGAFWFLEVNSRLQVEHGITELVTGLDLVHEQLWLASGARLSAAALAAAERAGQPVGHAIEVRISLEDPARSFLPLSGRVGRFSLAAGPGIRVDAGIEAGDRVPAEYDSLVAKLMVHAADRPTAIDRLRRALDESEIGGVQTTLPFHWFVAASPDFRAGRLSTDFVDEHWDGPAARATAVSRALLAVGLAARSENPSRGAEGPSRSTDAAAESPWLAAARAEGVDRWPG
jgi:acetyl/propionyl-CoA carboxylase alpha subunit